MTPWLEKEDDDDIDLKGHCESYNVHKVVVTYQVLNKECPLL